MVSDGRYTPEAWVNAWIRGITRLIWRNILIALIILGAYYVLGRLRAIIVSIVIAAILAYIMRPIATRLISHRWFLGGMKRHTRRVIATLIVLVLMCVAMYAGGKIVISPFVTEAKNLATNYPKLQAQWQQKAGDLQDWYERTVPEKTRQWVEGQLKKPGDQSKPGGLDTQAKVTEWGQEGLRSVASVLHNIVEVVLLPVLAFYFALDSKKIKHEFVALLPRRRKEVARVIHEFNQIMYSYVVGQGILCLLAGIVVALGLWILHMDYWVTLGLLAGITRAIPIIGPIIGGIPIIGLALVTKGVPVALGVLAFFTFLHFAESKFIMPMLIGDRMELHPVVIIVVLLIGGEFAGLLGMFFAPPVAAILRIVIRRYWLHRIHRFGSRSLGSSEVDGHPTPPIVIAP